MITQFSSIECGWLVGNTTEFTTEFICSHSQEATHCFCGTYGSDLPGRTVSDYFPRTDLRGLNPGGHSPPYARKDVGTDAYILPLLAVISSEPCDERSFRKPEQILYVYTPSRFQNRILIAGCARPGHECSPGGRNDMLAVHVHPVQNERRQPQPAVPNKRSSSALSVSIS